ncbi:MAG: hypothetical protein ACYC3A_05025 [Halothiobacillus sp.]
MSDGDKKLIRNSTAEFLIFTGQAGEQSIEARVEDETVWLTQKLMVELFAVDVRTISEHLKNIYEVGEVQHEATLRKFRIVGCAARRAPWIRSGTRLSDQSFPLSQELLDHVGRNPRAEQKAL